MVMDIERVVRTFLDGRVDEVGFAPVDRFEGAPDEHHPENLLKGAKTAIVLGRVVPRGILRSPEHGSYFLHRSYHTVYPYLDELAFNLANVIEAGAKHYAVSIPSYAPMVFHKMEPWGVLSLKHAAVRAGLGAFGKTGITYHPRHGSMLRLAAVVTTAEIEGTETLPEDPCPPDCTACQKACPTGAIQPGAFQKMKCLPHSVKHGIYPLALKSEEGLKYIERIINTAGHNYWLACHECLRVCPLNKKKAG